MANMTSSVSASQVAGELASATFEEIPALVEHYREDPRQQVIKACERALKRHAKELAERERVNDMYELMHELGGDGVVVGVDEVGRGSVAGPLTVCAVCLPMEPRVWGINDSKKLTEKKREALFDEICEKALAYRIIFVGPEVIDRENILNATMGGMQQAVEELDIVPNLVLVDGNRTPAGLQIPAQPVVKGDATSASIGAASVLAKVSRDRYMLELDKQYPQYQLAKHKGYPTKLHYELIAQYGIQPFYRRSFLKKQGYWPESGK